MPRKSAISFHLSLLAIVLALLAIEIAFLPMPGIQEDEAAFVAPLLKGNASVYAWAVGSSRIPVMQMDYVGSLEVLDLLAHFQTLAAKCMGPFACRRAF